MRDQKASKMFNDNIELLNKTTPREFRVRLLGLYEREFGITHSAACSLYNKIKKAAVANGIIPEIGRAHSISPSIPRRSNVTKSDTAFNDFLVSLELRIVEKDSWAVCNQNGDVIDLVSSGVEAAQLANGNYYYRTEPL